MPIELRPVKGVFADKYKRVWIMVEDDVLKNGKMMRQDVIIEAKSGLVQTSDFVILDDDADDDEDVEVIEAQHVNPRHGDGVKTCLKCGKPISKGAQERGYQYCKKHRKAAEDDAGTD